MALPPHQTSRAHDRREKRNRRFAGRSILKRIAFQANLSRSLGNSTRDVSPSRTGGSAHSGRGMTKPRKHKWTARISRGLYAAKPECRTRQNSIWKPRSQEEIYQERKKAGAGSRTSATFPFHGFLVS